MPQHPDTIVYNMRFPRKDKQLYDDAIKLAEKRRISLAELIRQALIKELDDEKRRLPDKS